MVKHALKFRHSAHTALNGEHRRFGVPLLSLVLGFDHLRAILALVGGFLWVAVEVQTV